MDAPRRGGPHASKPCEGCPARRTCEAPCGLLVGLVPKELPELEREHGRRSLVDGGYGSSHGRYGDGDEPARVPHESLRTLHPALEEESGPERWEAFVSRVLPRLGPWIASLSGPQRAAVEGLLAGKTQREIAHARGRNQGAVAQALGHARQKLRARIERFLDQRPLESLVARRPTGRPRRDATERFWAWVDREGEDTCWHWRGTHGRDGNGRFNLMLPRGDGPRADPKRKRCVLAVRHAYELLRGPIPVGAILVRVCEDPRCINPAHRRALSREEAVAERHARGLSLRGERVGGAKLSDAQAQELRRLRAEGARVRELAARFGISQSHVYGIVSGLGRKLSRMPEGDGERGV